MNSLNNIIAPIKHNLGKNIYILGLSLKSGKVSKIKIYNKIYEKNEKWEKVLLNFAGEHCVQFYKLTNEWMNLYPGFSGFAIGVEILELKNETCGIRYGFGFKDKLIDDIIFRTFYLNFEKKVVEKETYLYIPNDKLQIPQRKLHTELLEVKEKDKNSYCYCPHISFQKINELQYDIEFSVSSENRNIVNEVLSKNDFYIVNFGVNPSEEKIYILSKIDNQDITKFIQLIEGLNEKRLLTFGL